MKRLSHSHWTVSAQEEALARLLGDWRCPFCGEQQRPQFPRNPGIFRSRRELYYFTSHWAAGRGFCGSVTVVSEEKLEGFG